MARAVNQVPQSKCGKPRRRYRVQTIATAGLLPDCKTSLTKSGRKGAISLMPSEKKCLPHVNASGPSAAISLGVQGGDAYRATID
jgi:hypothetical protein